MAILPEISNCLIVETRMQHGMGKVRENEMLSLYRAMFVARCIDDVERELINRGDAFFHVGGAGHEASAAVAWHLIPDDFIHCHYRDKALMIARGVPVIEFFHGLLCNASGNSRGRQMSAHISDPTRKVLSIVGPVGNHALQAVGIGAQIKDRPSHPVVLCSLGDGTSQEGEVLEAIAEAVRWDLRILFLVQDNRYSISTSTRGKTFFSHPHETPAEFYGLTIHRLDGRDILACDSAFERVVGEIRRTSRPAIVVLDLERLSNHTNSDDETVYRAPHEITAARETGDPIVVLRRKLIELGITAAEFEAVERQVAKEVKAAADQALLAPEPTPVMTAKRPLPERLVSRASESVGNSSTPRLTMAESIRETLRARMSSDARVTLYGEDIEDPKGDVFGVTKGLTRAFAGRVLNSPVSESTIVGTSIGRALAGGRPVAFIQFADFLPLAFNQISMELGSMYWRTNGGWECPVIVMIACGAYRPGLGPFHSHTLESIACHVPGVDVAMPSTAADAAGILNAAFESGRPTLFFYPKACLNSRETMTSTDVEKHLVPVGRCRTARVGSDLTFVAWGNTVSICEKAADALASVGCSVEILDLRWLSPWDESAVYDSARKTGKLIVVHEDNQSCGFGAEVVATVTERVGPHVHCRRVTRPDTYVPCNFANQLDVLPSFRSVLTAAAEMLDLELAWQPTKTSEDGLITIEAIGSSPADETVIITELKIKPGQSIRAGDLLANLECDKALFDLSSPVAGIVEEIRLREGQQVRVGTPLLTIRATADTQQRRQRVREDSGTPILTRKHSRATAILPTSSSHPTTVVALSTIFAVEGSDTLTNEELAARFPGQTNDAIFSRTGIRSRSRVVAGQTALSMAVEAARSALAQEGLGLSDIDLIVCSTSTPPMVSPSLACLVLHELSKHFGEAEMPAYDVMAACTGYLYALGAAWDFLQSRPNGRVLVLTAETMSQVVNPNDFDTAVLFGDAATATIISGANHLPSAKRRLHRPVLSARGESGEVLRVPQGGDGEFVKMDGKKVFSEAVRRMTAMLERACSDIGWKVEDLDLIVPHQANGRIIEAVQARLRCAPGRVRNDVADHGNTSSSTIPLALTKVLDHSGNQKIGLCAFGAGLTFGAAVLDVG